MVSDKGKTFVAVALIIDSVLICPVAPQVFANMKVKWIFNLEEAPWWGGFFKGMIQCMKQRLRKAIGKAKLIKSTLFLIL